MIVWGKCLAPFPPVGFKGPIAEGLERAITAAVLRVLRELAEGNGIIYESVGTVPDVIPGELSQMWESKPTAEIPYHWFAKMTNEPTDRNLYIGLVTE